MLKTYELCPLKFYYKYVENISMPVNDEIFEFGKNIHALASYYLRGENIEKMEQALTQKEFDVWSYLKSLKYFEYKVINTEYTLNIKLDKYIFSGRLDALVKDGDKYYILDYKTGGVNKNDGRLDSLDVDEVFKDKHAKAIQMLLYAYLYHKHHGNPIASVELVPLRDFTHTVPLEVKDRVMDQQFFDDFESSLLSFFENNMCNADTPFAMCVDEDSCKRCNFTPLCLRLQDNE